MADLFLAAGTCSFLICEGKQDAVSREGVAILANPLRIEDESGVLYFSGFKVWGSGFGWMCTASDTGTVRLGPMLDVRGVEGM